jgi:hypothetical protein
LFILAQDTLGLQSTGKTEEKLALMLLELTQEALQTKIAKLASPHSPNLVSTVPPPLANKTP